MAVRKIRNTWWVDFRASHIRYRLRSPENTRAGAEAYEATLRQKLSRGEPIGKSTHLPEREQLFKQFAWKWFEEYAIPNNKHSEIRNKRYALQGSLVPFFGSKPISKITTRDVEQFKASQLAKGFSPKTINNRLTILSKCLSTGYEWLELNGAPAKIKLLKSPPPKTDYLSSDECELLLSKAEGVVREMIFTALRTGMRQGELKGLQWSSIDWETRTITVRHTKSDYLEELSSPKSNRERYIPMDSDVYSILFNRKKGTGYVFLYEDQKPFHGRYLDRRLAELCKKVGLRRITWHVLRHTFATHLSMKGAPLNAVQMLLGHSTIGVTMRYAHFAPSELHRVIAMLNPKTAFSAKFGQPVGNTWIETTQQESKNPLSSKQND